MSYVSVSKPSQNGRTFVVFHGTGGDEFDLLPLAEALDAESGWLSLRGQVQEGGALRFFRRHAEGVFDQEDLAQRTQDVADFVIAHRPEGQKLVALGFSNGANIAASVLLKRPEVFDEAILIRAMTPFPAEAGLDLGGKRILVLSGEHDPILPLADAIGLAAMFSHAGAEVQHVVLPVGHRLVEADVEHGRKFLGL